MEKNLCFNLINQYSEGIFLSVNTRFISQSQNQIYSDPQRGIKLWVPLRVRVHIVTQRFLFWNSSSVRELWLN